jgi:hypothetical protein
MKVAWMEYTEEQEQLLVNQEGEPILDELGEVQYETVMVGTGDGEVTGINRGALEGEREMQKPPQFFTKGYDPKYYKVVSEDAYLRTDAEMGPILLAERKTAMQADYKTQCTSGILQVYPEPIQRSASLGIYESAILEDIALFIGDMIAEENRLYDAVENARNDGDLDAITPGFEEIINVA